MAGIAQQSEFDEAFTDCLAVFAVAFGQPQPERPVGIAEPEAFDGVVVLKAAALEILKSQRRLEQTFVIVVHDLIEQLDIFCIRFEWTVKTADRGPLHGPSRFVGPPPVRMVLRGRVGRRAFVQYFKGVTKAHAVELLHELDGVAGSAAGHAVIQALGRGDDEVRIVGVLMERAQADQVPVAAMFLQVDPARTYERGQIGLLFDPVDFRVWYSSRHDKASLHLIQLLNRRPECGSVTTHYGPWSVHWGGGGSAKILTADPVHPPEPRQAENINFSSIRKQDRE